MSAEKIPTKFPLEVALRFVHSIEDELVVIEEKLHYIKEWIRIAETGGSLQDIRPYRKP